MGKRKATPSPASAGAASLDLLNFFRKKAKFAPASASAAAASGAAPAEPLHEVGNTPKDEPKPKCSPTCKICDMEEYLEPRWRARLKDELAKPYFASIKESLHKEVSIMPDIENVFHFSKYFPLHETRVVICGQDPYHNYGQAHGLSFSVPKNCRVPPSLVNIYKEIKANYPDFEVPNHGCLVKWAEQGVLLLNDTLTVRRNAPKSHAEFGWAQFTEKIIRLINQDCSRVVFMLWGKDAGRKKALVNVAKHLVLTAAHPSPFSAASGFFGCGHFAQANAFLKKHKLKEIEW